MSRKQIHFLQFLIHATLLLFLLPVLSYAQPDLVLPETPIDGNHAGLTELSLEDLMNIEVTSVSKKAQKLSDASAAIFVITQEDIRRSGVTSIPEALRMVPGLQVARINTNQWAITSRGFNSRLSNKLLVLIDGRSVYSPLFSGVYWNIQDTLLEDLDRIEIIRGPGATLWGANAVNGVINILTKNARDTQGGLVVSGAGTEERGFVGARYGAKLDGATYFRVYAKHFNRDDGVYASGNKAADDWNATQGGFRLDREQSERDFLTLQGDTYDGSAGQTIMLALLNPPYTMTTNEEVEIKGGNVLLRWQHIFSEASISALQIYYDRTEHKEISYGEKRDTFDMDWQHRFVWGNRHEIVWEVEYRFSHDSIENSLFAGIYPDSRDDDLLSASVQDDITLIPDCLRLTMGVKYEHNDYTGSEFQPNGRLLWTPDENHSFWAAISRAVRTPSRSDQGGRINQQVIPPLGPGNPGALPRVIALINKGDFDSEELLAYELGYRTRLLDTISLDMAAFYNDYRNLSTVASGKLFLEISPAPAHLVEPFFLANKMEGETYGAEVAAEWQTFDWWRLKAIYSYLQMQLYPDEDNLSTGESEEGRNPHHQFSARSSMDLPRSLECDLWVRYADDLPSQNVASYITLDARLAWSPRKDLDLAVVGQNLFHSRRSEFKTDFFGIVSTEVQRSVYGKITWRF